MPRKREPMCLGLQQPSGLLHRRMVSTLTKKYTDMLQLVSFK